LTFPPNKITALVGDSGSGKSTLTNLLMRIYDPDSGVVEFDGTKLQDLDLTSLHK